MDEGPFVFWIEREPHFGEVLSTEKRKVILNRRRTIIGQRTLTLWKLELKRTIRQLPVMLLETILLMAVFGTIALGASKILYRDAPAVRITIAVVEEEDDPLTDLLLYYVQGMESISELCRFLTVSEEEGISMLREGEAAAMLVLPKGMTEGIMNGSNVPAQVFFPEDAGMESALLKELTDAGVQMLRVAQAQIYGIYDTAEAYGALEQLSVMEMDVDKYNLAFALNRLALFRTEEISAAGNLSMLQYGIASGAVFFLLLLGMACYPVMRPYPPALQNNLYREGIGAGRQCFGKWLCGVCSMGFGASFFWLAAKAGMKAAGCEAWLPKAGGMRTGICLLILCCAASFVFLVFQIAGNGTTAVLLLFFLTVFMQYFSGGFLPSAFLPDTVRRIGRFFPTAYLIDAAGSLYLGRFSGKTAAILFGFTVLFGASAYGIRRWRMTEEV